MAHFANIENNVVTKVIVISNDHAPGEFPESEILGQNFIASLGKAGEWKQTSYNGNFRKHFAGIGFTYDEGRDAFIPPRPFDSWLLNEQTYLWEAPVPMPLDGQVYNWDESTLSWVAEDQPSVGVVEVDAVDHASVEEVGTV